MSFAGLKSHAVTLYEAGKLGHTSTADLCKDLSTLEGTKFEGEMQEFANHAFSLWCVLECLISGGVAIDERTVNVWYPVSLWDQSRDKQKRSLVQYGFLTSVSSCNEFFF